MKPTLSPERLAHLDFLIDSLDELFTAVSASTDDLEPFLMGKISTARADLAFVRDRASRKSREVRVVVLEEAVR